MWTKLAPYLPGVAVLAVLIWRQSRSNGTRLRLTSMWIGPILVSLALIALMATMPPPLTLNVVAGLPLALALGLATGWLRARHMDLSVDPATGTIRSKATPIGMMLLVALFAARYALKFVGPQPGMGAHGHLTGAALLWTDLGLLFSAGLVWGRAITLLLRVRPLLEAHRAARAD